MGIERVALIFDNLFRPETTGVYCLRALRELVHVEHFLPQNLDRIPRSGFDLYLNIDDGLHYRLPAELRPSAWWAIDTHMDPLWAAEKGRDFDWLFAAQRDGTERLRQGGINAHWLPLACDPAIHKPHALSKYWDVCFVGRVSPGAREDLLVLIRRNFPNSFAGQRYFEEYAKTVSQSRVGFNRSIKNDVNMRVFETLGCGTLLMTNDLRENGQEELLMSDRHFVTYRGPEELVDKLHFYLRHDDARERIAQAGHAEAVARHTYRCRMQSLLESIQERRTIQAVRGPPPHDASETAAGRKAQPAGHRSGSPQSENDPAAEARPSDSRPAGWLDSIDFIVKTFLRPQALLRLLRSVSQHYPDARLTIADDGNLRQSEDADSRACCALIDENERFVLHTLPFATGVTPGRNLLVDKTDRPFLLLLDDDFCFNAETRIERLWERLNADPEVGVVAGACIDVVENERRPRNSGGTLDIQGDTLIVDTASWRDRDAGLRDYVPQFALVRREIFRDVRWEGGLGAEHYDFCLQLHDSKWKVAQDVSVQIDHFHFTPALPGYVERRFDFAEAQQWLLRKWNLRRLVQDGQVIVEQVPPLEPELIIPGSRNPHIKTPVAAGSVEAMLPVKDLSYFEFPRPEVVALVPESARRVLDIGCGAGRLGALIKERQPAEVTGIEFQPQAAALARQRLDRVLEQNVEDSMLDFPTGRFDCVVCADILEHLREPAQLLQKIRRWLSADGCLVASLPNTRHHSVVSALLEGNWTYEAAGLLDGDHVRFFTRREIEKLLYRQGFEMQTFQAKPGPGYDEWASAGRLGEVRVGPLNVGGLTPDDAQEFFTYQYLLVARPSPHAQFPLTSIVIVTHNQLGFTKECVDSIRARTDEPYELVFVDNGSTDGTVPYLRSLLGGRLIENPDNRGFPAAVNQGLRASRGEYVVLLNNDTVVTTGWLRRMLDVLESDPRIGLAGPCSNCVSGAQMVPIGYQNLASLDGIAWEWGKRHHGVVDPCDRLVGFCLAIKRRVIDQIGLFDERFAIGCFEDDDFCLRAVHAGWRAVIVRSAFVHHYGNRTFAGAGIDLASVLRVNREKFLQKWNGSQPVADTAAGSGVPAISSAAEPELLDHDHPSGPIPEPACSANGTGFRVVASPSGGLLLKPKSPQISLCMIVRDNEATIGPCLESIRPWVDEINVVDTGSKDRTLDICRRYGARIYRFAWCDHFSAARNESLRHATGDWIFWMDSDDTIPEECGRKLRALVDGPHDDKILGYVMQVHCPGRGEEGRQDVTIVDHVKLIRNRRGLCFDGRIHEQLLPAIRRAQGDVAWTDICVVHSGSDHSVEGRERKLERDLRILHLELQEIPDHPFVLFNLGMTYADAKNFTAAIGYLERCVEVSQPVESHLRKAFALLTISLGQANRHDEAWKACQRGLGLYPDDKELLFRCAILHHHFGRLRDAEQTYQRVLNGVEERHFMSIEQGLATYIARHNLAVVYDEMGCSAKAEAEWRRIVQESPDYNLGWRGLGEILLRQGKTAETELVCGQLSAMNGLMQREFRLLQGRLAAVRGDVPAAVRELQHAHESNPADLDPLRLLCQVLFEHNELEAAAKALEELTERAPDDAAALHNLGTVRQRMEQHSGAASAFQESLKLRPNSVPTYVQLGYALYHGGATHDATAAWKKALEYDPGNRDARAALNSA